MDPGPIIPSGKHMETTVKVSLGPHTQTKASQHLSCLLTCGCKSQEAGGRDIRRCANHTEEIKSTRHHKVKRKGEEGRVGCHPPVSFFPHFSLTKKEKNTWNHLFDKRTEKSLFHTWSPDRLFLFSGSASSFTLFTHSFTEVRRSQWARCCSRGRTQRIWTEFLP